MRMVKLVQVLWTLALAAVVLLPLAGVAFANVDDVSTERTGSIIVFPKVVWDGQRDTIIQIANTTPSLVHAHCFYLNGAIPTQCSETDFDLWLTNNQPTHWVASVGRFTFMAGDAADFDNNANDAGFSPGLIPPVEEGFIGELKCVQVGPDGVPVRGNALKGEATIRSITGDVSEYNAIAFRGNPRFDVADPRSAGDYDLTLDLTPRTDEQTGDNSGMYSACPDTLLLNHLSEGVADDVINQIGECTPAVCVAGVSNKLGTKCVVDGDCGLNGVCGGCPISTELTLIPCSEDFEDQAFKAMTVQFIIINEFEQQFSASTKVNCYLNVTLSQISSQFGFTPFLGTFGAYTRITSAAGKCDTSRGVCVSGSTLGASCTSNTDCPSSGGVIGLAEEFRAATTAAGLGPKAAAAYNIQTEGNRFDAATNGDGSAAGGFVDHIIIPQP